MRTFKPIILVTEDASCIFKISEEADTLESWSKISGFWQVDKCSSLEKWWRAEEVQPVETNHLTQNNNKIFYQKNSLVLVCL